MINDTQIRMAKAALKWSNTRLSEETGLHKNTLNKAENGTARPATLALLQSTFEKEGVLFVGENGVFVVLDEAHKPKMSDQDVVESIKDLMDENLKPNRRGINKVIYAKDSK